MDLAINKQQEGVTIMVKKIDRRTLIKTAGATAALAGFGLAAPAIHSANHKVVRYLGTVSYTHLTLPTIYSV